MGTGYRRYSTVATLSIALYVLRRSMSASDIMPEVALLSSALKTSIYTPLPLKMYTSALVRTVNWVTLVPLLVGYLLYLVIWVRVSCRKSPTETGAH